MRFDQGRIVLLEADWLRVELTRSDEIPANREIGEGLLARGKRAPVTPRVGVHRLDQKLSDTSLRIKRTERGYGLERRRSGTYEVLAVPSESRQRAKKRREG